MPSTDGYADTTTTPTISSLYQRSHYTEIQIVTFTMSTLVLALCILALALRIYSRLLKHLSLALNDILAGVAFLLFILFYILGINGLTTGMGRPMPTLISPDAQREHAMKLIFCFFLTWVSINTAVKLSMLHLYLQLFPQRSARWICWVLMALLGVYWATAFIFPFANCRPFARVWDQINNPGKPRSCLDNGSFLLPFGIVNIVLDVVVIVLPMPYLYTLKLRRAKRVGLMGIFALGFGITMTSSVRAWKVVNATKTDFMYASAEVLLWSLLETGLSVVNCCLPLIQPAVLKIVKGVTELVKGKKADEEYLPTHKFITLTVDSEESGTGLGTRRSRLEEDLEKGRMAGQQDGGAGDGVGTPRGGQGVEDSKPDAASQGEQADAVPACRIVEMDEELVLPPRRKNLMWYLYG